MRRLPPILLAAGFVVAAPIARADEPPATFEGALVRARFALVRPLEGVLVPVRLGDKEYQFAVDTGATTTLFDKSLVVGAQVGWSKVNTSAGELLVERVRTPEARLGDMRLSSNPFSSAADLNELRRITRRPIFGIVGMDVLVRYVVRLDCRAGELLLLDDVPRDPGTALPLVLRNGTPHVTAELPEVGPTEFLVDTGGTGGGALETTLFQRLLKAGHLQLAGERTFLTAKGEAKCAVGTLDALTPAGFRVPHVTLHERDTGPNTLGLDVWSRFVVTFDFLHERMYLRRLPTQADEGNDER